MRMVGPLVIATVGVALTVCTGCGYTTSNLLRDDIDTVYVAFFDNATFRRELEVPLTRAVVNELKLRTHLLFAPRDEADSLLTGELIEVEERSVIKDVDDHVLRRRVAVKVRFRWTDLLTGEDIVPEQVITESARIVPLLEGLPTAGDFDVAVQRDATPFDLVFQETAQRIVERMEKGW